jgi:hypothetical protein
VGRMSVIGQESQEVGRAVVPTHGSAGW